MFTALHPPARPDPYLDLDAYDPAADLMVLNLGPQHPSTHGVFRVKLVLDGEVIVKAVSYPGFLHRGVEKLCEKLTYANVTPIFDKNDYIAPMLNEQAVNMAFEKLLGLEVPRRARWLRTLLAEMQRIASHLIAVGTFALDVGGAIGGGASVFMYAFRDRDRVLDLFEELTGCRFHYNTHQVGGNRHDVPPGWDRRVLAEMDAIESALPDYVTLTAANAIFRDRTVGVGVLGRDLALELGLGGPIGRASGVDLDLRRDAPYHCYDEVEVRVPTFTEGDCYARFMVRYHELVESIRLVRQLVQGIPEGPIAALKPTKGPTHVKIKEGQAYVGIESPRGELGTYLIAGGNKGMSPYRLKIRPPSLHALATIPYLLPGNTLSDAIAILGSLDPVMGEVDR
ncbi:MAG: NADH-quinone oxidoreductase subunit D [Myxococcales bacterium]|nr:NADH-quinone oxidoreductase subunit D [Myxococcales bacterium]